MLIYLKFLTIIDLWNMLIYVDCWSMSTYWHSQLIVVDKHSLREATKCQSYSSNHLEPSLQKIGAVSILIPKFQIIDNAAFNPGS